MNPFESLMNLFKRRKAEEHSPGSIIVEGKREDTAVAAEDYESAARTAALQGRPSSTVATLELGAAMSRAEKAEQEEHWQEMAEAWSTILLKMSQTDHRDDDEFRATALFKRADAFTMMERYKSALGDLENAVSLRPDRAQLWSALATVLLLEGKIEKAHEAVGRAMALDKDDYTAKAVLKSMGIAVTEETLESAARAVAQQGGSSSTTSTLEAAAARLRAEKAEQEERWQDAIEAWRALLLKGGQAIGDDDDLRAGILLRRAKVFTVMKRYKQALDDLENALSLVQNRAEIWSAKAAVLLLEGRTEQAYTTVLKAVALDQNDNTVKAVLMRLVELGVIPTVDRK